MSSTDQVAIILVHYNSETETKKCLQSLAAIKHDGFRYRVIVVDNASKEPLTLSKSLQAKNIDVIRSEKNLGFTGGNNLGIWYAKQHFSPQYILLLNNDTLVEPRFLEKLLLVAKSNLNTGVVTPKIYFAPGSEYHTGYSPKNKGKVIWYAGGSIDWLNLIAFHKGVDELDRGQFDSLTETEFATGCCMLIPMTVLDRVGTLDKSYFLYLEDVDFSLRVKQLGYNLYYQPESVIWHLNSASSGGSGSALHQYYQSRNRLFLGWRFGNWRVKKVVLLLSWQFLTRGNQQQRRAVLDFWLRRMGKQRII